MFVNMMRSAVMCAFLLSLALMVNGCDVGERGPKSSVPSSSLDGTSSESASSSSTTSSVTASTTSSVTAAGYPGGYRATTVIDDLRIPWEMRFIPDGRLLITERQGRVLLAEVRSGTTTEIGHIAVLADGEGGLMGLALDPDFPESSSVYVSYTYSEDGNALNRVSRFTITGLDGPTPGLDSETILVDGIPAGSIHNGSRVAFGPDGYLWVTTGDSGKGDLAQRPDSLAGKVLRMTTDGKVPPGNPYETQPYPFALIFTLGHRNPQGLTFHPHTGQAYVTEHGPSSDDEINKLQMGGNYGWPNLRGRVNRAGFIDPVMTWSPTIAPAGTLFYSGAMLSELTGALVFVTLKESDLRVLVPTDEADFLTVADEQILFDEEFGRLRAVAQGPEGALYVGTSNFDGRGDPRSGDDRIICVDRAE